VVLIKLLKEIRNPYVAIYDECIATDAITLCYVCEFFEDGNMEKVLEKMNTYKKHFSEDRIFDCVYYVVDALNFLHDKGISHKDLKPK
jgi:serine/threonine protein kinase